jgi:predicted metal-binding protein
MALLIPAPWQVRIIMSETADHTILICSTCEGPDRARAMKEALKSHVPEGVRFRAVDCLAGCDFPPAVGFQAQGKATYLFGKIATAQAVQGIAAFAHQYCDSDTGWTNSTQRPSALSDKTLARIPALKGVAL